MCHETRDWFPWSGWRNKETLLGLPEKSGHLFDLGGNISQEPRMSERREEEEELVGEGEERRNTSRCSEPSSSVTVTFAPRLYRDIL